MVTLTWPVVPEAVAYNVYRGTSSGRESSTPVAARIAQNTFVDQPIANGPTYYYTVTALNDGGQSARSDEVSASPEAPAPPVDPATLAAFRLLRQSSWGPKPGEADAVKAAGASAYVAGQLALPPSAFPDTLLTQPVEATQEYFMQLALTGPDQLRQRVAWALHKIWVVSAVEVNDAAAILTYYRSLYAGAFGNYRDLMRTITINPAMGRYLNMLDNKSQAVTGVPPNENYARELLQLFTLGLVQLDPAGAPVTDPQGVPLPTYTEADVKELARILTGWTFGDGNPAIAPRRTVWVENFQVPMEPVESYHDHGAKTFLGEAFLPGQTARQDLEHALDVIFAHGNIAPFVSRQLIQQLVTSNPSPQYVADIAAVFANGGAGRGDLAAVVQAILLHPEAGQTTTTSGKLAEPVLFIVSPLRALNALVTDHPFMSDMADEMGQKVFYPPSVFSYVSPGYRVRGTGLPPLIGPEFQTLTSVTALARVNFISALLEGWYGSAVQIDFSPFTNLAGDPAALVDYVNTLLMGGRMSLDERTEIVAAVRATPSTDPGTRARTALFLTLVAAQAQVDR